jgi:asparagine synthase (glutamine-hydrolysing)
MGWAGGAEKPPGNGLSERPDGSVCSWDGRIDNRQALLSQTGLSADCTDAVVVHELYARYGVAGLGKAVGDWSLVIWDALRREIVLASDFAGIRPLYYHRAANGVFWSSSLDDMVRWTGSGALDADYAASFLVRGKAAGRTPYAGILPAPAGGAVSVSEVKTAARAFWTLPIDRRVQLRDEREYEERLRDLFREAVRSRMAVGAPTCAELSGGLDSSSIVCMADRLRRETPGSAPELVTFSYTHENSPDEKFIREVERVCRVTARHLDLEGLPWPCDTGGSLPALWEPRFLELRRRMADLGAGVLLTGQLGDFAMGNTHDDQGHVADCLARGRFGEAARAAYRWGRAVQAPVYPILWRGMREAWFGWIPPLEPRAAVGAMPESGEDSLPAQVRERFRELETERLADDAWRHAPPGRRLRFRAISEVLQCRTLQAPEPLQHISYTHPYAHRPLLEFMLAIPGNMVARPDEPRRLMRRAFAEILPAPVLARKSKASYRATYREALVPLAKRLLQERNDIRLVELGHVDRLSLLARLEKFVAGVDCNETQLRQILVLELWLRGRVSVPLPLPPDRERWKQAPVS